MCIRDRTHTERFNLMKQDGSMNEGAYNAFSFFAKTALQDYTLTEIDHNDLVGRYIQCSVEHDVQPSNKDPNKTVTFIRLGDKSPADGFDEEEVQTPAPKKAAPTASIVLNCSYFTDKVSQGARAVTETAARC